MEDDEPAAPPTAVEVPIARRGASRASLGAASRYQSLTTLGKGGMGEVIAARDDVLGREVAIKRMLDAKPDAEQEARFLREARIQGALDHPAIPPVHELAYDDAGRPYFVMKRLVGTTLSAILKGLADDGDADVRERYPRQRLLRAFADVCLAVELAHTRGVVHRDLKPANIMLGEFGEVFVLDWGVAKIVGDIDPWLGAIKHDGASPDDITTAGTVIGTRGYMSPEQRAGDDVDARADVFALGCILYELLVLDRARADARDLPLRPTGADIPPELADLCTRATAPDRSDRPTARLLGERVQRFLDGDRDLALRRHLARDHLERGLAAAARTDDASRRDAIREAGRAMALDPTLEDAAALVGRLMLEPPRDMPGEVAAELAANNARATLRLSRIGLVAYGLYMAFIPLFFAIGVREPTYVVAFALVLVGASVSVWFGARRPPSSARAIFGVACNAAIIAILGRMLTPFMLAPGLAAVTVMLLASNPLYRGKRWFLPVTTMMLVAATAGPWLLEVVGASSPTLEFTADAMVIRPPGLEIHAGFMQLGLLLYSVGIVVVTAALTRRLGRGDDATLQQVHLQSWQLRQLLPG